MLLAWGPEMLEAEVTSAVVSAQGVRKGCLERTVGLSEGTVGDSHKQVSWGLHSLAHSPAHTLVKGCFYQFGVYV